jgi:hypothetical protein
MPRLVTLGFVSLTALTAIASTADAQTRRRVVVQEPAPLLLRVRPRSFLEPGNVVPVGSLDRTTSGYAQTQSYLLSPPYAQQGERFGVGILPDPITNGPFVGARNPFGPIDFVAPPGLR